MKPALTGVPRHAQRLPTAEDMSELRSELREAQAQAQARRLSRQGAESNASFPVSALETEYDECDSERAREDELAAVAFDTCTRDDGNPSPLCSDDKYYAERDDFRRGDVCAKPAAYD